MLKKIIALSLPIVALAALSGCENSQETVHFQADIKPILDSNCTECHRADGAGTAASGLQTVTYETLMKGTKYGPVIVPGNPESSTFYRLIAGLVDPSIQMPHGKEQLSAEQILAVENWIKQGAKKN